MKVSLFSASVGLAAVTAVALLGATPPAHAEGTTSSPLAVVEGLVIPADTAAGPQGFWIHPAFGADVHLVFDANTHFRKAGGSQLDTPDELSDSALVPAVQKPTPAWFVGLFARAAYKADNVAVDVSLSRPEPLLVDGVVTGAAKDTLDVDVSNRGSLHLTLNGDTACRMKGLAAADGSVFQAGDLVQALFWLMPTGNEALRVNGRLAPLQHFEGILTKLVLTDGGSPLKFEATRGTTVMSFTFSTNPSVKLDDKPATLADLKTGLYVSVYFRKAGGDPQAVGVLAFTPKPSPTPKPKDGGTGDKGKGNTNTGDSGKGNTGNGDKPKTDPVVPKPVAPKPQVVEGLVSAALGDGSVFKVKVGATDLSFTVDAKTQFRINDKAATSADLVVGQHVHVVFLPQADGSKLAMYVLIHKVVGPPQEHGTGGGTGQPQGSNTGSGTGGGTPK